MSIELNDLLNELERNYPRWMREAIGNELQSIDINIAKMSGQTAVSSKKMKDFNTHLSESSKKLKESDSMSKRAFDNLYNESKKLSRSLYRNSNDITSVVESFSDSITNLSSRVPRLGIALGGVSAAAGGLAVALTNQVLKTNEIFGQLGRSGIVAAGGFTGFRTAAHEGILTMEQLSKAVAANTAAFARFGTEGPAMFSRLSESIRKNVRFMSSYGLTVDTLNEFLSDHLETQRLMGRIQQMETRERAEESKRYLEQISLFSSVLGKSRDQIMRDAKETMDPIAPLIALELRNVFGQERMIEFNEALHNIALTMGAAGHSQEKIIKAQSLYAAEISESELNQNRWNAELMRFRGQFEMLFDEEMLPGLFRGAEHLDATLEERARYIMDWVSGIQEIDTHTATAAFAAGIDGFSDIATEAATVMRGLGFEPGDAMFDRIMDVISERDIVGEDEVANAIVNTEQAIQVAKTSFEKIGTNLIKSGFIEKLAFRINNNVVPAIGYVGDRLDDILDLLSGDSTPTDLLGGENSTFFTTLATGTAAAIGLGVNRIGRSIANILPTPDAMRAEIDRRQSLESEDSDRRRSRPRSRSGVKFSDVFKIGSRVAGPLAAAYGVYELIEGMQGSSLNIDEFDAIQRRRTRERGFDLGRNIGEIDPESVARSQDWGTVGSVADWDDTTGSRFERRIPFQGGIWGDQSIENDLVNQIYAITQETDAALRRIEDSQLDVPDPPDISDEQIPSWGSEAFRELNNRQIPDLTHSLDELNTTQQWNSEQFDNLGNIEIPELNENLRTLNNLIPDSPFFGDEATVRAQHELSRIVPPLVSKSLSDTPSWPGNQFENLRRRGRGLTTPYAGPTGRQSIISPFGDPTRTYDTESGLDIFHDIMQGGGSERFRSSPENRVRVDATEFTHFPGGAVPEMAQGGVANRSILANIGEGSSPEMVMPLDPAITDLAKEIAIEDYEVRRPHENEMQKRLIENIFRENDDTLTKIFSNSLDRFFFSKSEIRSMIRRSREAGKDGRDLTDSEIEDMRIAGIMTGGAGVMAGGIGGSISSIIGTGPTISEGAEWQNLVDAETYLHAIGQRESGGDYGIQNTLGFAGKYQFGAAALEDLGYLKSGASRSGNVKDVLANPANWTGKDGVNSISDFLNNPRAQENAARDYTQMNLQRLRNQGVLTQDMSSGQIAGLLAASHLGGTGGAANFARSGQEFSDAYGTNISEYFALGQESQVVGFGEMGSGPSGASRSGSETKRGEDVIEYLQTMASELRTLIDTTREGYRTLQRMTGAR